ncbi:MAG TPA: saccharopine dehydrogenase NADP-binding domain-containing protein [Gammaproteobacteria bacterium]|nr:saccharopine dehydrogenase NADP-binding domain-containing protein [Gammaproteobacteria bacterium]
MSEILVYGAYGYTGRLIVDEARAQGLEPVLAGRDAHQTRQLATESGLTGLAFDLADRTALDQALIGRRLVLHCAGPFAHTWRPMAEACLRQKVHYLDITGEIEVFEALATLDASARKAGVMLLPGVGFDVVPTDCMAAHLKQRLPAATQLTLAFMGGGGFSRGTRRTMLEGLGAGGLARRDGRIQRIPAAWKTRRVDFGTGGVRTTVTIPWGDVATAYHSTGIPNIETYAAMPRAQIRLLRASRHLGWLFQSGLVQTWLRRKLDRDPPGPAAATRADTRSFVWGEALAPGGGRAAGRLICANGYSFTARSAVAAARRVLAGEVQPGFRTPSRAFGADFIRALDTYIEDLPA